MIRLSHDGLRDIRLRAREDRQRRRPVHGRERVRPRRVTEQRPERPGRRVHQQRQVVGHRRAVPNHDERRQRMRPHQRVLHLEPVFAELQRPIQRPARSTRPRGVLHRRP